MNPLKNTSTESTELKNTYKKYCPNVFLAKCHSEHVKGDIITLTTRYGKEHECIVFNLIYTDSDSFYYSIVRQDGFNSQEYAKKKAEKLNGYSENASKRSTEAWEASKEGHDIIPFGQPILVGHHSEKKHRALIKRNWNRMDKMVAESRKSEAYKSRAQYWESKVNDMNLSMPACIEFYEYQLEDAKEIHEGYKDGTLAREHSYSLTYAKKKVNNLTKDLETAIKLWG